MVLRSVPNLGSLVKCTGILVVSADIWGLFMQFAVRGGATVTALPYSGQSN